MENKVTEFFKQKGFDLEAVFTGEDTSTVAKAAAVLGVEDGMIAKSLAFRLKDGTPIVLVVCGTGRIDNHKFKEQFHCKASMLSFEDTLAVTGHPVGGVCPFALPDGVGVYLDKSLKKYEVVYPAAGTQDSAVRVEVARFEEYTGGTWVDVCKEEAPAAPAE
ncbi:YbaK/EbsC family protein [Anaerofilum hominis]|uniref:YbaK/EbsC family protein n=1 Tax=Anaerofilum hominis TaxID=2763016 RepID=UPI00311A977A